MFLSEENNNKEINQLLSSTQKVDCAVAFIGEKAEALFSNVQHGRIVCNLDSGCTNPKVIKALCEINGIEIKNNPNLHAKVYICQKVAIVSSSNLSSNGLGLEGDEVTGWLECGYKVESITEIERINNWFSGLWERSSVITENDILKAQSEWEKRRKNRPVIKIKQKSKFSKLVEEKNDVLLNRRIYFAVTYEYFSKEADEKFNEIKKNTNTELKSSLSAYEDWNALPADAYLIDIYVGSKGGISYDGLYQSPAKKSFVEFIAENGKKKKLFLCHEVDDADGFKITNADIKKLTPVINEAIANLGKPKQAVFFSLDSLMSYIP
jgi:hypothetical protein